MRLSTILWLTTFSAFSQPFEGYVPPGTVHFSGNLFMDITEVSNLQWSEFEYYVSKDSSSSYTRSIAPNGQVTAQYRPNYYTEGVFGDYPVVGISNWQASEFCKWRTNLINSKLQVMYKNNAISVSLKVKYRLPTELEWSLIASQTDTMKYAKPGTYHIEEFISEKNIKALKMVLENEEASFRKAKQAIKQHKENDMVPMYQVGYTRPWFATIQDQLPVSVYYPDNRRLSNYSKPINLIGNVAELVQETGITKGGSWRHKLAVSFPSKSIEVNPDRVYDWVGFRCICEVSYLE